MNKQAYRIIFNARRGQLMAVAETASAQGKAASGQTRGLPGGNPQGSSVANQAGEHSALSIALSIALGLALWLPLPYTPGQIAHAQIKADTTAPGNQRPTVLAAPNGVPVVNIQTPSAAGVSRNTYSQFDVGASGAILNNSRTNVQSQLGGWVQGNPWLATGSAKVILNEVNTSNTANAQPSQLKGAIEVAGPRAEVVIANPAGIQIDGAGFINASSVTLTTGTAQLNTAGGGSLDGYRVQDGSITVTGAGLDARQADYTNILARAVELNAGIWAQNLVVATGSNHIAPGAPGEAPKLTPLAASSATSSAPSFALDVSQLGGMYAGKIFMIGTEAGVGVRNSGTLGATAGDVVLQTNGWLTSSGVVQASGNTSLSASGPITHSGSINTLGQLDISTPDTVTLSGTATVGTQATVSGTQLTLSDARISAQNASLTASRGNIDATRASIATQNTLTVSAAQALRTDAATLSANQLNITAQSLSNVGGQLVQSGTGDLNIQLPGTLDNTRGQIATNSQNMNLSAQSLNNTSGQLGTAGSMTVQTAGGMDNTQGKLSANAVNLSIATLDNTQGQITSNGKLTVQATSTSTNSTTGNSITNTGILYAVGDQTLNAKGNISNTGIIAAKGHTHVQANSLSSTTTSVLAAGLDTQGQLVTGTTAGAADLSVTTPQALTAQGQNLVTGTVSFSGASVDLSASKTQGANITVTAGHITTAHATVNTPGTLTLQAGPTSTPSTTSQATPSTPTGLDNTQGQLSAATLLVQVANINNAKGQIVQTGQTDLAITTGAFDNSGGTVATNAQNLRINATTLANASGTVQHAGTGQLALNVAGAVDNRQGSLSSSGSAVVNADSVNNSQGRITAVGALTTATGQGLNNTQGTLAANGALTLSATSLDNTAGTVASVGDTLSVSTSGVTRNDGGLILAAKDVLMNNLGLSNTTSALNQKAGNIVGQNINIDTHGQNFSNAGGSVVALDAALLKTGALNNDAGLIQANSALRINTNGETLQNTHASNYKDVSKGISGGIVSQGTLTLNTGDLNNTTGSIASVYSTDIQAQNIINNANGKISSKENLTITSASLDNQSGRIQASGDLSLSVGNTKNNTGTLNNTSGLILSAQTAQIESSTIINSNTTAKDNEGNITQGIHGENILLNTSTLNNESGHLHANNNLDITAYNSINNSTGTISSGNTLIIQDRQPTQLLSITNTNGSLLADKNLNISSSNLTGDGNVLVKNGNLSITLTHDFINNGKINASNNATINTTANITNNSTLQAGNVLTLNADSIDNTATGEITGTTQTVVTAKNTLTNRGLIDGSDTQINAGTLNNWGTGRIYGDHLSIQATTINNDAENHITGTLAARNRLDIGVTNLNNNNQSLIFSDGNMAIGASLNSNRQAIGSADTVTNTYSTIESTGQLDVMAKNIQNKNAGYTTSVEQTSVIKLRQFQPDTNNTIYTLANFVPQGTVISCNPTGSGPYGTGWAGEYVQCGQPVVVGYFKLNPTAFESQVYVDPFDTTSHLPTADDYQKWKVTPPIAGADPASAIAEMNVAVTAYNKTVQNNNMIQGCCHYYDFDLTQTTTQTTANNILWGKILSGADMNLTGSVLNDVSQIVAGGTLTINGPVNNQGISGTKTVSTAGWESLHGKSNGGGPTASGPWAYTAPDVVTSISASALAPQSNTNPATSGLSNSVTLNPAKMVEAVTASIGISSAPNVTIASQNPNNTTDAVQSAAQVKGAGTLAPLSLKIPVGAPATHITLPSSSLFHPTPSPTAHYLVETDPRFANYKTWLSSDYMLSALNIDPATTQKRLGDGFYEQKLVREQVLSLTGQRFLGDFSSDEAEYQALMSAGVTFAQAYDLRPGIALTPAQVAHLTSNIVWLETATVDLPDGGSTQVLMPKVYMAVHPGDLESHGALLAAKSVAITTTGDITNSGSITGAGTSAGAAGGAAVRLTAQNIHNVGGLIQGDTVRAAATQDLNNIGGVIRADSTLVVSAGRDVNSVSTVRRQTLAANGGPSSGEVTNLDQVAGLYVGTAASNTPTSAPQANGTLVVAAGRDVKLQGSALASTGRVQVAAGNNIVLGVVQTSSTQSQVLDAGNAHSHASTTAVASGISAQGDIALRAGQDVQAQGAQVSSQQGALDVSAARDVLLSSAQNTTSASSLHTSQSHGLLSSSRETSSLDERQSTAQGSALSGNTVSLHAGRDATITGSNVVSDSATAIAAANTLTITGAQNAQTTSSFSQKTESGLLSGGGFGISYGHRDLSQDAGNTTTTNAASTVGSVGGNVTLSGKNYVQTGSDVSTPGQGGPSGSGDITINAQNVAITEARESSNSQTQTKFSQSGITVAISNPVVGAVQSADQLRQAASKTSDGRMQALAAGSAALGAKSAVTDKDGKFDADKASSVSVSVSLGQSKSQSNSTTTADTAGLSTLTAGGNITINAKTVNGGELANPADSNITLQGVQIKAGDAVTLDADNRVNILAAKNTQTQSSTNSSSSASVGVAIQYGAKGTGYGFTAAASAARGSSDGTDTTYTNSHISAGNQVNITSGGDTTIKGGVVTANTVKANVGGDLKVESLQDTSVFTGKQSSAGGSVMIGAGGGGSVSASKTAINNNFASVAEQSGIRAGDGGFQVSTKGDTTLTGGAITSTQAAVDNNANTFTTSKLVTSDLQNRDNYSASGFSVGLGTSTDNKGKSTPSASLGVGSASGSQSSSTQAAISGIAGNTAARTGDTSTGLVKTWDGQKMLADVNAQTQITAAFGNQASKAIGDYANKKQAELQAQGNPEEAAKWAEGGTYRAGLHAVVGGLTGGVQGALGAGMSQLAIDSIGKTIASSDLPTEVKQALIAGAGTVVGAAVGGSAGAAAAGNATVNNYLSSADIRSKNQKLSDCRAAGDGACEVKVLKEYDLKSAQNSAGINYGSVLTKSSLESEKAQLETLLNDKDCGPACKAEARKSINELTTAINVINKAPAIQNTIEVAGIVVDVATLGEFAAGRVISNALVKEYAASRLGVTLTDEAAASVVTRASNQKNISINDPIKPLDATSSLKSPISPNSITTSNDGFATWTKVPGTNAAVRIESSYNGLNVTDIYNGGLSTGSGSQLLAEGLNASGLKSGNNFSFSGIINPETIEAYKSGTPASESLLGKVATNALSRMGLEAASIEYSIARGKLNIEIKVK